MRFIWLLLVVMLAGPAFADTATPLNGPWAFHMGDDPRYAQAQFDDSTWERVDLTPKPGAHDGDVGLPGYVPGWTARGHKGEWGHAWYRLHVHAEGSVLVAPTLVDGPYIVFWNGRPVGGIGNVGAHPQTYAARPMRIELGGGDGVLAIHTWLAKDGLGDDAGGIHVAPVLATPGAAEALYLSQWWRTFWGYVADFIEPVCLWIVALLALGLRRFAPGDRFLVYAAGAAAAIAASRINQCLYAWGDFESLDALVVLRFVIFNPLAIVLWVIASGRVGGGLPRRAEWAAWVLGGLAGLSAGLNWDVVQTVARLGLLVLAAWGAVVAVRATKGSERVLAAATLVAMAVALFADELSKIGVPGIWFPWGVGVSRTQYALAVVVPVLTAWVWVRAGRRV